MTGLALGICVAAAASLMDGPPVVSATEASPAPVEVERTSGPQPSGLPRLRSDSAPAAPPEASGNR